MNPRNGLIRSLVATALLAAAAHAQPAKPANSHDEPEPRVRDVAVTGVVFVDANGNGRRDADEKGMAGAWVSDGEVIVDSAADGAYRLSLAKMDEHRCVFATPPPGFRATTPWHRLMRQDDAAASYTFDFGVQADPRSLDKDFRFVVSADSQFATEEEGARLRDDFAQIAATEGDPRFHVICGDLVMTGWLEEWKLYAEARKAMTLPHYDVFGGHGGNYGRATRLKQGTVHHFNLFCGPSYYSWHYGGRHFVVTDQVHSHTTAAQQKRQETWLKALAERLPPGTEIVYLAHYTAPLDDWREKFKIVAYFYGHYHENTLHFYKGTPYLCINAIRGGDWGVLTRAFRVCDFRGGAFATEIRPLGQYERLDVVWPQPGGAIGKASAGFRVMAYDSAAEVTAVKAVLRGPGREAGQALNYERLGAWAWGAKAPEGLAPGDHTLEVEARTAKGAAWRKSVSFRVEDRPSPTAKPGDDWPGFFKNAEELRATRERLAPPLELVWMASAGGRNEAGQSPVVWKGRVFAAATNDDAGALKPAVTCFDALTGKRLWTSELLASSRSTPAIVGGRLVAMTSEGEAAGIEVETGKTLWRAALPGFGAFEYHPFKNPVMAADGLAVLAGTRGAVTLVDPATGRPAGQLSSPTSDRFCAAPFAAQGSLFVAARDRTVRMDIKSGKVVWNTDTKKLGSRGVGTPFVSGGRLFHCTQAMSASFDAATGEARPLAPCSSGGWGVPTPAMDGKVLFAGGTAVVAMDAETGKTLWRRGSALSKEDEATNRRQRMGGFSSPAVSGDWVYVGTDAGEVCALDKAKGEVAWRFGTGAPVKSSPVVSGGMLFVSDYDGNVYGFASAKNEK